MPNDKSAFGGSQQASFNRTAQQILNIPEVTRADDLLVMVRGEDGKPQIFATGDPRKAQQLWQDAGTLVSQGASVG